MDKSSEIRNFFRVALLQVYSFLGVNIPFVSGKPPWNEQKNDSNSHYFICEGTLFLTMYPFWALLNPET